jgi:UV DNA damage endonuclease
MIILENDDTSFTLKDTLYLCEKLEIPLVFDYHHHLAHHETENWREDWERVIATWEKSKLPIKMHISSPRSKEEFRAHSEYIDLDMFWTFLREIKGTVPEIHCMIEAKQKDQALFELTSQLSKSNEIERINQSSFQLK